MERAAALRAAIEAAGGASYASSAIRIRSKTSLVEALAKALAGKTASVDEATQAVLEAGYRSTSPELANSACPIYDELRGNRKPARQISDSTLGTETAMQ